MIKIVCPECGVFFKPLQNGVIAEEWFMHDSEIYAIWSCDVLECPGCGKKILAGFPNTSIGHNYDSKFDDALRIAQKAADQGKLYEIYEKPRVLNVIKYVDLGWANGWKKYPPEILRCRKAKHKVIEINRDPSMHGLHTEVRCDICRIIYHYDSSG